MAEESAAPAAPESTAAQADPASETASAAATPPAPSPDAAQPAEPAAAVDAIEPDEPPTHEELVQEVALLGATIDALTARITALEVRFRRLHL